MNAKIDRAPTSLRSGSENADDEGDEGAIFTHSVQLFIAIGVIGLVWVMVRAIFDSSLFNVQTTVEVVCFFCRRASVLVRYFHNILPNQKRK